MLRLYSSQNDIVIGSPVANRHYNQVENLIGFFVNSIVLRVKINSKVSIKELIQLIGDEVVNAQLHQDLPFEKLVEELNILKDTSRHPIFQVMFGIENFGSNLYKKKEEKDKQLISDSIANLLESYETGSNLYKIAKFDISTFINDSEAKLRGSFNYAVSLYAESTIEEFIRTYIHILEQLAALSKNRQRQEQTKVENLHYLGKAKYEQIIKNWNSTDKEYPTNKTIHQLFEEQVERTPESIAVVYEDKRLTYRELNNKANQLARYLIQTHSIVPDTLIALCLSRSEQMLIAILAVLKSGSAYVPVDPSYPDERITYILKETNSKIILTSSVYEQRLQKIISCIGNNSTITSLGAKLLAINSSTFQKQLAVCLIDNPNKATLGNDLAYVIFTSGTTGNPKGVMIEHKSLINSTLAAINHRNINAASKVLQSASYAFDSSLLEIYPSLLAGATLFILNEASRKDIYQIHNYCSKNEITTLFLTTKLAEEFLYLEDNSLCLTCLIAAGEKFSTTRTSRFQLINEYGPTENTVCSTYFQLIDGSQNSSIGKPIPNIKCYVLDCNGYPVPVGAIGELYLGGAGLARGYLNQPGLTAEKFIANPFQTKEEMQDKKYRHNGRNSRLYKTGDLVRWLPDGNLEYIGRNDFQVKIRGYRIELGEIENVLGQYQEVKQCVVLAKAHVDKDGDGKANSTYLVGYYTTETGLNLEEERVISHMRSRLPDYMVPNVLVHLESFPLTSNGKLDRQGLPNPQFGSVEKGYVAPRSELEEKVCQVWAEVLGLAENQVGIYDDFFRLGGNSILAIKIVSRLNNKLHHNINVSSLFRNNTIEGLVRYIRPNSEEAIVIEKATIAKAEQQLLSFAQKRLWFIEKYEEGTNAYNIPLVFEVLEGTNLQVLESSIKSLLDRHEILRTVIREDDEGNPYQQVLDQPLIITRVKIPDQIHLDQELKKTASYI